MRPSPSRGPAEDSMFSISEIDSVSRYQDLNGSTNSCSSVWLRIPHSFVRRFHVVKQSWNTIVQFPFHFQNEKRFLGLQAWGVTHTSATRHCRCASSFGWVLQWDSARHPCSASTARKRFYLGALKKRGSVRITCTRRPSHSSAEALMAIARGAV